MFGTESRSSSNHNDLNRVIAMWLITSIYLYYIVQRYIYRLVLWTMSTTIAHSWNKTNSWKLADIQHIHVWFPSWNSDIFGRCYQITNNLRMFWKRFFNSGISIILVPAYIIAIELAKGTWRQVQLNISGTVFLCIQIYQMNKFRVWSGT